VYMQAASLATPATDHYTMLSATCGQHNNYQAITNLSKVNK